MDIIESDSETVLVGNNIIILSRIVAVYSDDVSVENSLWIDGDHPVMDRDGLDEYIVVKSDHSENGNSDIYKL